MLRIGASWRDCPPEYGPHTTIYNRFHPGGAGKLHALVDWLGRLVAFTITPGQRGDAPVAAEFVSLAPALITRAYDSDALRRLLVARGTTPVIPNGLAAPTCIPSTATPTSDATSSNGPYAA